MRYSSPQDDTTADCIVAAQLIEGFQAEYLLADCGCDTDAIILKAVEALTIYL